MGGGTYCFSERTARARTFGYHTKSADEIFTQSKERRAHDSMSPKGVTVRECRDSVEHPNVVPVLLALDLTGSMGAIPHDLVKDGLPTLMGNIIQSGVDPALLFVGVGDNECDHYPLQVGQFEASDEALDMWLTRTYIEGGGGGNTGESYFLAWYFAAHHTVTDAFEKRGKKGFLFTIGDEPCLNNFSMSARKEIMGETAKGQATTAKELLEEAQQTYNVYHLHVMQGSAGRRSYGYWKDLLGQNCIKIEDYRDIPKVIAKIVSDNSDKSEVPVAQSVEPVEAATEMIL